MFSRCFITGIHSGLGAGLARALSEQGAHLHAVGRTQPAAGSHENLCFAEADFADLTGVPNAVKAALAGARSLDLVILNAGVLNAIKDMAETPVEEIEHVLRINTWAHKVVLDTLYEEGVQVGQVVAISSGAAVSGSRGWNAYSLSKAALNSMIQLYASERPETHFSALAPGLIDTGMQTMLSSLQADARYPILERLQAARGTEAMPSPEQAAPMLLEAMKRLREEPSGCFRDIRKMT